jgi:hypothetical protein
LAKSGVAVEKLVAPKFAKIKSRQDALQTTLSVFLDICYPPNLAVWDENGVFQQPQAFTLIDLDRGRRRHFQLYPDVPKISPMLVFQPVGLSHSE